MTTDYEIMRRELAMEAAKDMISHKGDSTLFSEYIRVFGEKHKIEFPTYHDIIQSNLFEKFLGSYPWWVADVIMAQERGADG